MAPYFLQWQQIQDAQKAGCDNYDFGGVKMQSDSSWSGITRFKQGFVPQQKSLLFLGSYDVVIQKQKYFLYGILQVLMKTVRQIRYIMN